MRRLNSKDGVRNEGPGPAEVWDGDWKDPDPLEEGFIRHYEFLHGYKDTPVAEYDAKVARYRAVMAGTVEPTMNEMMGKILFEEIQKEINREVIRKITGG